MPRTTVVRCLTRAEAAGLTWPLADGLTEAELEAPLYPPDADLNCARPLPEWNHVHRELRRKGVTVNLLWREWKEPPSPSRRKRHPGGRPTKRTPEVERNLADALRGGMPIPLACQYAGIAESTYHHWAAQFPEFLDRIRAEHALRNLQLIQKAAQAGDWRAAEAALKLSAHHRYMN